ncbi:hypothetical protein [Pseudomonas baltica]|uniref:hypothetical protein n=1 Tax=Pseudomonas baltica TaxID=2762576 RepID=UPI003908A33B
MSGAPIAILLAVDFKGSMLEAIGNRSAKSSAYGVYGYSPLGGAMPGVKFDGQFRNLSRDFIFWATAIELTIPLLCDFTHRID